MIVDLHMHSTASDGQYAPAALVEMVQERGIEVMALTDHDTVDGVAEAVRAGEERGLRVLRGVELSAEDYVNLHILGYGFSLETVAAFLGVLKRGRNRRARKIAAFLHEKGVDLSLPEVESLALGNVVGRPHFAEAMVKHGYVATRREAFDRYLDTDEFHEMDRGKPSAKTCVETLKAAGGKVSLAHPYQIMLKGDKLEDLVHRLKDYGLDALECFYPRHTPEQTAAYLALAKKEGLHVTGGSDFHGERVKPDISFARWELDVEWLLES